MIDFLVNEIRKIIRDFLNDKYADCYLCGGLFHRSRMHRVELDYGERFYCVTHKPPYDAIQSSYSGGNRYLLHQVRVNEDGSIYKEPKNNKFNKMAKHWTEMIFE